MSTRSVIARTVGDGFEGRYHHFDGYPGGIGKTLYTLANTQFKDNIKRMMEILVDEHKAGWSNINNRNFSVTPGYREYDNRKVAEDFRKDGETMSVSYDKLYEWERQNIGPECFCHGDRQETTEILIAQEGESNWTDWAYAIDEDSMMMGVFNNLSKGWALVSVVDLNGPEPDWQTITCGPNLERCNHIASYHFPEVTSRLTTPQYLGKDPITLDDCVSFTDRKGVKHAFDGCGHIQQSRLGDTWYSTDNTPVYMVMRDGTRTPLPNFTYELPSIREVVI